MPLKYQFIDALETLNFEKTLRLKNIALELWLFM